MLAAILVFLAATAVFLSPKLRLLHHIFEISYFLIGGSIFCTILALLDRTGLASLGTAIVLVVMLGCALILLPTESQNPGFGAIAIFEELLKTCGGSAILAVFLGLIGVMHSD